MNDKRLASLVSSLSRMSAIAVAELLEGDHAELRETAEIIHGVAEDLIRETREAEVRA